MTQMSDFHASPCPAASPNRPTRQARWHVARPLHGLTPAVPMLVFASLLAGCILPPSLSSGTPDAGQNSPPSIVSVQIDLQQLPDFTTITEEMGTNDTMVLRLLDTDVGDTLYVGLFVNYTSGNPTPARSACTAPQTGLPERSASCSLNGVCEAQDVNNTVPFDLDVVVFDRMLLDSGQPRYMAMPSDGLSASYLYKLNCIGQPS
jgi:hypothetical protein